MANILYRKLFFILSISQTFLSSEVFKTPVDRIRKLEHSTNSFKRRRNYQWINTQIDFQNNLSVPINFPSVLQDPVLVGVNRRLEQCARRNKSKEGEHVFVEYLVTESVVRDCLFFIDPDYEKKDIKCLIKEKFTVAKKLALFSVVEKLLQRCDDIVMTQCVDLESHNFKLRTFAEYSNDTEKYYFVKLFRLMAKTQMEECILPRVLDLEKYLNGTSYDYIFDQHCRLILSDDLITQNGDKLLVYPINLWMCYPLILLAFNADKLAARST